MSKRHDYTSSVDNHENFKRSAEIASWFKNNEDKPYAILIGTKLARLGSLLDSKEPKNESIEDSFLDLINYCALWMERRTDNEEVQKILDKNKDVPWTYGCNAKTVSIKDYGNKLNCNLPQGHAGTHRASNGEEWY